MISRFALIVSIFAVSPTLVYAADASPDYAKQIAPIFKRYCVGCHNPKDRDGKFNLADFASLMKGGENGRVIVPKNPTKSRLIGMVSGKAEPLMPPEGNAGPTKSEIALLTAWVKAGAIGPKGSDHVAKLVVPKIKPMGKVRRTVNAIVTSPNGKWAAVARHGVVEIRDAKSLKTLRPLSGLTGDVADLVVSRDGTILAAAAGEPGLIGEAVIWNTSTWKEIARLKGHGDSLYAVAVSPNGKLLATGSYDQKIKLWDIAAKKELRQLDGHNGPVHDLAFHPGGKLLASASGDRTIKLWDVATGKRLDTLGQPEKEQYAVAFSPDGKRVVAGGVDNRIRVWAVTRNGKEGTIPLLYARFSHEAAILRLVFSVDGQQLASSGEDRTVKLWETAEFTQLAAMKNQSDWVTGLAFSADKKSLIVGRQDGSLAVTSLSSKLGSVETVQPILLEPVPKPDLQKAAVLKTVAEHEPNDSFKNAQKVAIPANITGVLQRTQDFDHYRIRSKAGQVWILETNAARSKSPADTKVEVLHADGRPVLRYQLRAVRDSYITFRPIDSRQSQVRLKNWEEMDLNQYLYMGGEVGRLFRAPRGPDSGFDFYTNKGKRRTYFGTSATVHANEEPVYIVEPYPPSAKLVDNGLPVFPIYYANDDDGERELGNDSRLTFTAPADGDYLVRVSDTRGVGGADHKYTLTIRQPRPDFRVSLSGAKVTVPQGSGKRLTVNVDRIDGFNGEIRVDITGMPRGFHVTSPIIVEADHLVGRGVITVDASVTPTVIPAAKGKKALPQSPATAAKPIDWSKVRVTATAMLHGRRVTKTLPSLGPIAVSPKPKVLVRLEVDPDAKPTGMTAPNGELVIVPGTTITAMLRIERNGFKGELKFDVDHLPHGVIVDNIGLSGILIRNGETHRRVYLTAADWVPETTRQIDAIGLGQGNPASPPITLHVRRRK